MKKIVFLSQKQLKCWILTGLGLLLLGGVALNSERITRRFLGAKSGVILEGCNVSGLYPTEVTRIVRVLAEKVNREPQEATYFPETGEVIPEQTGKRVEIAETVKRVFAAKSGTQVNLKMVELTPQNSAEFFKPVYHGNPEAPKIALAINVAWGEEHLPEMLKVLKTEKVKATFFFVGTWVKMFPEMVKEIADQGHEIANHGSFHGHPLQMNREALRKIIMDNNQLLTDTLGKAPSRLFAPPYGEVNEQIAGTAGELGFRTIMWSVDTIDWKSPTPEALLDRVLKRIEPGGIILMHPTVASRTALPTLIQTLKKRKLQPVRISELIEN